MHLLVWTTCVAVHLAVTRTLFQEQAESLELKAMVGWCLYGIGAGTAWASLAMLVWRRRRGRVFPLHPGEWLWVALGLKDLYGLAWQALTWQLLFRPQAGVVMSWSVFRIYVTSFMLLHCLIFLATALQVKVVHWRRFMFASVAAGLARWLVICAGGSPGGIGIMVIGSLVAVLLVVVLVMDLSGRNRYPWSHWLGVGLGAWYFGVNLVMFVWSTVSMGPDL
jgi:hypothetical protein